MGLKARPLMLIMELCVKFSVTNRNIFITGYFNAVMRNLASHFMIKYYFKQQELVRAIIN